MAKITELSSLYRHLEKMSIQELVTHINTEDQKVALAVKESLPYIIHLIEAVFDKMKEGGRLFYLGAGTSGRLGILDASECPPTFGVPHDWVIGLIAGGDQAIRKAVEHAEDDIHLAWEDLMNFHITREDVVVGIAASGSTPYVVHGLKKCSSMGIMTGCITCNPDAELIQYSQYPVVVVVGPEFLTGSTRMKAGTAQKMVLNMITTSVMIKLGRVKDNKMVDMQLTNNKLWDRGVRMIVEKSQISPEEAKSLLQQHGSVREVIKYLGVE
ncbi:MAG TPA: N-acetylmuramic acid 6-phosphate etherase [Saprospiraceae bacterium]|nr:N-acetylmuramic acid 6-phosphate etherase [Saprospiraceae bacterium]